MQDPRVRYLLVTSAAVRARLKDLEVSTFEETPRELDPRRAVAAQADAGDAAAVKHVATLRELVWHFYKALKAYQRRPDPRARSVATVGRRVTACSA